MNREGQRKAGLSPYGLIDLAIIPSAEALMFLRVEPVYTYFTPIVWSGYILFIDSIIGRIQGRSLIGHRRGEFGFMLLLSVVFWLVFEGYNLSIKNWPYRGFPEQLWNRCLGLA